MSIGGDVSASAGVGDSGDSGEADVTIGLGSWLWDCKLRPGEESS